MLLLLAALVQAPPTLDTGQFDAARTCARVSLVHDFETGNTITAMAAHSTYFVIAAAAANPAGKSVQHRILELNNEITEDHHHDPADAALYPQCGIRFPHSRNDISVILPDNAVDRAGLCAIGAGMMTGMSKAAAERTGDHAEETRARTIAVYYTKNLHKELAARGIDTAEKLNAVVDQQLAKTVELGTLSAIENSCEAAMR